MTVIYDDELITVKTKGLMSIQDMPIVIDRVLDSALIGTKTYCQQAKDPMKLWKLCKKQFLASIQEMEDIISKLDQQ